MKKTFFFTLFFLLIGMTGRAQTVQTKTIDNGGTGMFKAIAVKDSSMSDFVIYRPKDLAHAHARCGNLPILMWANGACMDTSAGYERMLTEIASHGYVVMAIGEMEDHLNSRKQSPTEASELQRGLDWLCQQNETKSSEYYHYLATTCVAAAGHSCGGAQVLWNAADTRLRTCLIMNAGMGDMQMAGASRASLPMVHTPIIYITGGPTDVAYENAKKDFERIGHVPAVWADHPASGHGGTYGQPNGGDYGRVVLDWLDWQLKGQNKSDIFLGGTLKGYDGWSVKAKNFEGNVKVETQWILNGDRHIYGKLATPLSSAEGKKRGIVIVSHGFNGTHHFAESYFEPLARLGYAVYAFDFPCGSVHSMSDPNTMEMSILDEQSDLRAIVNYFRQQPWVDTSRIVLIGESQGGLVSALTAAQLKSQISKLILVYPALCIPDNWRARYPKLSDIPEETDLWGVRMGSRFFREIHDMQPLKLINSYRGPVFIIQGDKDTIVSMEDSKKAVTLYKDASLYIIQVPVMASTQKKEPNPSEK